MLARQAQEDDPLRKQRCTIAAARCAAITAASPWPCERSLPLTPRTLQAMHEQVHMLFESKLVLLKVPVLCQRFCMER